MQHTAHNGEGGEGVVRRLEVLWPNGAILYRDFYLYFQESHCIQDFYIYCRTNSLYVGLLHSCSAVFKQIIGSQIPEHKGNSPCDSIWGFYGYNFTNYTFKTHKLSTINLEFHPSDQILSFVFFLWSNPT